MRLKDGYMKLNVKIICIICLSMAVCFAGGCAGKADSFYDNGNKQFAAGKYSEAADSFKQAIEINPDKAEYYINYGTALINMGEYDSAREQFLSVIRDTDNKIVRENNKKAYRGIALAYYAEGTYDQAKAYLELALKNKELTSVNRDLNAYLAECEMYLGDYEKSLKVWNELIDGLDGKNKESYGSYYLGRAKLYAVTGNADKAAEDYRKCVSLDKKCYAAYLGLYLMQTDSGDEQGAADTLEAAMKAFGDKQKESVEYYILLYYNKDIDNAKAGFQSLYDNGEKKAVYYLGRIAEDTLDYETAASYYEIYQTECPDELGADFYNQYAGCLTELEKYDEALELITKGKQMAAGTVGQRILFNEVIIYEKLGNYKTAEELAAAYLEKYQDEDMENEYEYIKTRYTKTR